MKGIRPKLILSIVAVFVLASGLMIFTAYRKSMEELKDSVENGLGTLARETAAEIHNINDREVKMLESIAKLPMIRDTDVDLHEKWYAMNAISEGDKYYFGMAIYDQNGVGWTTTNKYSDLHEREYLAESMKGKIWIQDPNWSPVNGNLSTFYAHPVYDKNNKQIAEVVAVVDSIQLCNKVSQLKVGKERHPFVINMETGAYVAADDVELVKNGKNIDENQSPELIELVKRIKKGESGIGTYYDVELGQKMTMAFHPVGGVSRWAVVCMAPYHDFYSGVDELLKVLIFIFIICTIVSIVLFWVLISVTIKPLLELNTNINAIASGNADLTQRIKQTTKDEIGSVVNGFNNFTGNLQDIISGIKHSNSNLSETGVVLTKTTQDNASAITQIIGSIDNVGDLIEKQSNSVNSTVSAINEIASNIESLDKMIETQASSSSQAAAAVEQMMANINSVMVTIDKMAQSFALILEDTYKGSRKQKEVSERVSEIEEQSQKLQEANSVIASIAGQTNLLAMNAAIEAAHAGESGKGFSVVADEIRKLSETSSNQSKEIGNWLSKIRESITNVVTASRESDAASGALAERIKETDEVVQGIKNVMDEQNAGSQQISQALLEMNNSSLQVRNASSEMALGNRHVLEEVSLLQEVAQSMQLKMSEMATGAKRINNASESLKDISDKMKETIGEIGGRIDQFKV